FMETHPHPERALSDSLNVWPLGRMRELLETLKAIDEIVKTRGFAEQMAG
ncbi:MAG: 3-deoxy-8-phosphooctulonate synthase, partial [Pseudomonadota bacterium]|nr:3-deoxy-8-phosphooctulonate synthase [Pseudomonadota bacterium]